MLGEVLFIFLFSPALPQAHKLLGCLRISEFHAQIQQAFALQTGLKIILKGAS